MVQLGDRVEEIVSGYSGIAVARTTFLSGGADILVKAERVLEDGSIHEGEWIAESMLDVTMEEAVTVSAPPDVVPFVYNTDSFRPHVPLP